MDLTECAVAILKGALLPISDPPGHDFLADQFLGGGQQRWIVGQGWGKGNKECEGGNRILPERQERGEFAEQDRCELESGTPQRKHPTRAQLTWFRNRLE